MGVYINADEIEKQLKTGTLSLADYQIEAEEDEIRHFCIGSSRSPKSKLSTEAERIHVIDGKLIFDPGTMNSYYAATVADFLRAKALAKNISFTFETVMSHPSKVELLSEARSKGYRTYLYFIATEDPEINVFRVRSRVKASGHPVPEDKIVTRYWRSLDLLARAIKNSDRAYIFDNSNDGQEDTWIAEITGGETLEIKSETIPNWFKKAVLDKSSQ